MTVDPTRRKFIAGSASAGIVAIAGCTGGDDDADDDGEEAEDGDDEEEGGDGGEGEEEEAEEQLAYEIWALDQGRDVIYIYESGDAGFNTSEYLDLHQLGLDGVDEDDDIVPHMIDYSSDYEYAAVACTVGGRTLVFRTEDYELVADIDTGASSHMAAFSPDDEYIHVDAIGEEAIVRVDADLENEEFEVVDEIDLRENETVLDAGIETGAPICHQYAHDGRSLHTLGPSYHDGALVIVDHEDFTVDRAYSHDELPTNCGTMPHPEEEKFYLTAGLPSDPDEGEEGVGEFYVYDTAEDEILTPDGVSTEGIDAHGFWFTPDGEELWVLNRETNDGVVVDPETDEVIDEIEAFGEWQNEDPEERDAPDIMWSSPDGQYMFATLRGPDPQSGDPHAATGVRPGFSVLDVETREIEDVVQPDPIQAYSDDDLEDEDVDTPDFHGIGVVPLEDVDTEIPTSPPF